jgi:hypothetical protein
MADAMWGETPQLHLLDDWPEGPVDVASVLGPQGQGAGMNTPKISRVEWLSAKEVLGHEAKDFTPWLHENLKLLAEALRLEELRPVETEPDVQVKSLDILATGVEYQTLLEWPTVVTNGRDSVNTTMSRQPRFPNEWHKKTAGHTACSSRRSVRICADRFLEY